MSDSRSHDQARGQREAKVLASLNHPNIGAIYGFEDGRALVLELVEGETLEAKVPGRPLPIDDALRIARDRRRVGSGTRERYHPPVSFPVK